ncbi:MAG: heavy metal translocating P-type ATPase metal-binding domain-containing protein [Cyclobacteriaceae bacterium]|nr:heavy metal translocating P-type ATPase metal-binding domain-containing protein [Cyclobacteriaceae bacterium]
MQQSSGLKNEATQCYHCGTNCTGSIEFSGKPFCCEGCKTVFRIISENGLDDYYTLEKFPGKSLSTTEDDRFAYLENEQIADTLYEFKDGEKAIITLKIPDVHCSSCVWLLENLSAINKNVLDCRVNFIRKEATISFLYKTFSLRKLAVLLSGIGYSPMISASNQKEKERKKHVGGINIKLGLAGFCFGNVMLLSFPEYFGISDLDKSFADFFSYLNLIISLPVLYSASGYFISAFAALKQKIISIDVPIALGITALFLRSSYEVLFQVGPGFFDSFTGLVFFLLIGKWFQGKTYEALSFDRDFRSYFPLAVNREVNGDSEIVPLNDICKGDVLRIRNQEIIPADSKLLSESTRINYSFVSGEEDPISIMKNDFIYAGGKQIGASILVEVLKPVSQGYLSRLWERNNPQQGINHADILNRIGKYFTIIVLIIATLSAVFWSVVNPSIVWETVTAVLIVACPCALALTVPFTYGNVVRILGRFGVYLKNTETVGKFFNITHLIFDKTGTLTLSGAGEIAYNGSEMSDLQRNVLFSLTTGSVHPYSVKISNYLKGAIKMNLDSFSEIHGKGLEGVFNGNTYRLGAPVWVLGKEDTSENASVIYTENNNRIGSFVFKPQYREGLKEQLSKIKPDFNISVLSGDNEKERAQLKGIFPPDTRILFNQKPEDKLNYISKLQNENEKVLMIGDGLNDAPALIQSDLGISVTDDIAVFTPSSDVIMDGRNLSIFSEVLNFIKNTRKILISSILISFLYNIVGLSFAVTGNLTPLFAAVLMPLSSISVVVFTSVSVFLLAHFRKLKP